MQVRICPHPPKHLQLGKQGGKAPGILDHHNGGRCMGSMLWEVHTVAISIAVAAAGLGLWLCANAGQLLKRDSVVLKPESIRTAAGIASLDLNQK